MKKKKIVYKLEVIMNKKKGGENVVADNTS